MLQLALVIPGKLILVWACCFGIPVLAVVILTVLVGILKKGEAKGRSNPK